MNKYKVTDINNASFFVEADAMDIETINNIETYLVFNINDEPVAFFNLSNIIGAVKEN